MFKKKLAAIIAAAFMTLSASSAFAAFADLELFRVVYERGTGTLEYATDLGNVKSLIANGGSIAGSAISAGTPSNLYVAYFALDRTTKEMWVGSASDNVPVAAGGVSFSTIKAGSTSFYNTYGGAATATGVVKTGEQSFSNSYASLLSANQGQLVTSLLNNTEVSLASLVGHTNASVTETLYYIANGGVSFSEGTAVATIITNGDGSTTVTATPIPPAFFLMGSGLLGMFGLRRKNKVA